MAVGKQALKVFSLLFSPRFRFIGINADVRPTTVPLNELTVVAHLRRQRVKHCVLAGRDPRISGDPHQLL